MQAMQTGKQMKGNRFDAVQFEPYVFQSYPKMVGGTMAEPVIVNSAEEEAKYLSNQTDTNESITEATTMTKTPGEFQATLPVLTKKEKLLAQATELGVEVDPDWSVKKLEREIGKV